MARAKSSHAPVFTLPAWRQTIVGRSGSWPSTFSRSSMSMAPCVVGQHADERGRAEAEQLERPVDGRVPLGPGDHPDARCADEAVGLDVVPRLLQHPVPATRDADRVGGLGAGHEADRGSRRQAQQVLHPATRRALGRFGGGRQRGAEGVLVPADGQDVGGRGGRRRPADHEAEEPRTDRSDQVPVGGREQLVDHLVGGRRVVGQRTAERRPRVLARRRTGDGPVADGVPVARAGPRGADEQVLEVAHSGTRRCVVGNSAE